MWLSTRGLALGTVSAQEALGVCMTWPCHWQHSSCRHLILFQHYSLNLMRVLLCPVSWADESEGRAKSRLAHLLSRNSPLEQSGWSPFSSHPETQTDEASVGLCVVTGRYASAGPCPLTHGLMVSSSGWDNTKLGWGLRLPSPFPESPRGHQVEHARAPTRSLWSLFFRWRFPQICLPPSGPDLQMELGVLELFTSLQFWIQWI